MKPYFPFWMRSLLVLSLGCLPTFIVPSWAWTSHDSLWTKLIAFRTMNSDIVLDTIGFSSEGRAIPLVAFNVPAQHRSKPILTILITAEQHGDEPAAMEGVLRLIADLAHHNMDHLKSNVALYIVPQVNPDGAEKGTRRNGNNADLNRDHLLLMQPETQALYAYFRDIRIDVNYDVHEYPVDDHSAEQPYYRSTEMQLGVGTNLNISKKMRSYMRHHLLPAMGDSMSKAGFTFGEYIVGDWTKDSYLRHSTVDIDDGRQGFGVLGSFCFIAEGLNGTFPAEREERRTQAQYTLLRSFLKMAHSSKENRRWLQLSLREHRRIGHGNQLVHIRMEHQSSGRKWPLRLRHMKTEKDTLVAYAKYNDHVESTMSVQKPLGYLIHPEDTLLIEWLHRQGVRATPLDALDSDLRSKVSASCYAYALAPLETAVNENMKVPNYNITFQKVVPPNELLFVDLRANSSSSDPWTGTIVLKLILALEPNSMFGLWRYDTFAPLREQLRLWRIQ
jgi:hypothetical protein